MPLLNTQLNDKMIADEIVNCDILKVRRYCEQKLFTSERRKVIITYMENLYTQNSNHDYSIHYANVVDANLYNKLSKGAIVYENVILKCDSSYTVTVFKYSSLAACTVALDYIKENHADKFSDYNGFKNQEKTIFCNSSKNPFKAMVKDEDDKGSSEILDVFLMTNYLREHCS